MSSRNWFSNFLPFVDPLRFEGEVYVTPEHFYQAMKTRDPLERSRIAAQTSAGLAKKLGRKVALREDWDNVKYLFMLQAQFHRFKDSAWRIQLMATEGEIVEWNTWHDRYWGKCTCARCNGQGMNWLGKILMDIRDDKGRS